MPVVPRYSEPQVERRALPGVGLTAHVSEDAAGAGIARGLGAAANASASITDQQDQVRVLDAENQIQRRKQDLQFNQETGALTKRGKDALGVVDPTMQAYQAEVGKISAGLASDRQRALFLQRAQGHGAELYGTLQQHVAGQAKALDETTTNAARELNRQQGIASAADGAAVQISVDRQRANNRDFAGRNGRPEEWIAFKNLDDASTIHAGAIENLIATGQDDLAAERFAAVKGQMQGGDQTRIAHALDLASTRGQAQAIGDKLMLSGASIEDGLASIAKETADKPKLREAAEDRWLHLKGLQAHAEEQHQRDTHRTLYNQLTDPKNTNGIDGLDPVAMATLDPARQSELRAVARRPDDRPTDPVRYHLLYRMATDPDKAVRDQFQTLDLMHDQPHLSNADFHELDKLQSANAKGDEKVLAPVFSRREVADQFLKGIGINPNAKAGTNDALKVGSFYRVVNNAVQAHEQETGKPATSEQVQAIIDRVGTQHVLETHWYGDKKARAFELPNADKIAFTKTQVPKATWDQATESYRRVNGSDPTDDEILTMVNGAVVTQQAKPETPDSEIYVGGD